MPIGIVSDDDFNIELNRLNHRVKIPDVEGVIVDKPRPGRDEGDNNVPNSLRKIIGEEVLTNGRQAGVALAKEFNISPSSVSAYTKGATSTASYNSPSPNIVNHLNKTRRRIIVKSGKILKQSLDSISQEKLDNAEPKDLASIAKDMAVIIKNMEPQQVTESNDSKTPQFVIFAPTFRQENTFESVKIDE